MVTIAFLSLWYCARARRDRAITSTRVTALCTMPVTASASSVSSYATLGDLEGLAGHAAAARLRLKDGADEVGGKRKR